MLFKLKILCFLIVVGFFGWNSWKLYKKYHPSVPAPSVQTVQSSSFSEPSKPVSFPPPPSPSFVRCSSWGTSSGFLWGYGEGLVFNGFPDKWENGSPVFERWRGEPL